MAMNRKQRRAKRKERLKVIRGGKLDGRPTPPRADTNTPAGRFAVALDAWTKQYFANNADLEGIQMCAVLLQVSAGLAVDLDGNYDEYTKAAGHFFIAEFEARKAHAEAPPPAAPTSPPAPG